MNLELECTLTLGTVRKIVMEHADDADTLEIEIEASVESGDAYEELDRLGLLDDEEWERKRLDLRELRDAIVALRRGDVGMAMLLFERMLDSPAEFSVVEQAIRAPAQALLS